MAFELASAQGLRDGGSGGTSYPGPGLGGPGLRGPGRVQVSALTCGVAPSGVFMGLNLSEGLFFCSSPKFGQRIV